MDVSVVVPIRCDVVCGGHEQLRSSLRSLRSSGAHVVVADGSDPASIAPQHRVVFEGLHHVLVTSPSGRNGKVAGVRAGIAAAAHERVVLVDDDVIYDPATLGALARRLDDADLVVPQNFFLRPAPWHATWDTARTLINRAAGMDYPGTLAIRRSMFERMGGYDDDVLFENLELMRTVRAAGGRVRWQPDLYVPRLAPTFDAFARQRVRQAYDDLAQPSRLVVEASILPAAAWAIRRRPRSLLWSAIGAIAVAEVGRRRAGGRSRFPTAASLLAPMWVTERAICVWLAIGVRVLRGGVRYRGGRLRKAASSPSALRRRYRPEARSPHGFRRTGASSATVRNGRAERPPVGSRSPIHPHR
jgi:hypothetical protein